MTYRSQSRPQRRGSSRQFSKSTREKKTKAKKQRAGAKYLREETPQASPKEVAEKTVGCLGTLGNQIFALSPFSQYFDDWLVMLRQTMAEFETNPAIKPDEQFIKERTQIILDVEGALAEKKIQEANITEEAKALSENNHKIVEADKEYAEKTRELSNNRNVEVQRLSNRVRELEDDLAAQKEVKIGFFKFKEKRLAAEKLVRTTKELGDTKTELEVKLQNFTAEQEKLHDSYEKQKQELNETSDRLHRELEKLETDTSSEPRQTACNSMVNAINELLKRTPTQS